MCGSIGIFLYELDHDRFVGTIGSPRIIRWERVTVSNNVRFTISVDDDVLSAAALKLFSFIVPVDADGVRGEGSMTASLHVERVKNR